MPAPFIVEIERIKNTQPQTELLAKKRLRNVKNAFALTKSISAKHVAILDDVITTGHTINELARTLSDNGVEKIEIWCCAKTSS
ncbi:ComF family protein [Coxiella burnetii]|uniref:ComF family protein n=1 Tax=Coxiella burnetii TaxID=777 RepID=UPI0027E1F379|nr:phosphoribosyltransferase family protein [Coxiella burnetii]